MYTISASMNTKHLQKRIISIEQHHEVLILAAQNTYFFSSTQQMCLQTEYLKAEIITSLVTKKLSFIPPDPPIACEAHESRTSKLRNQPVKKE